MTDAPKKHDQLTEDEYKNCTYLTLSNLTKRKMNSMNFFDECQF